MSVLTSPMRVCGIDPGLTRCGVGIVDVDPNRSASLVHVAVIRTPPDQPLEQRLLIISEGICELLEKYAPDRLALERVFAQHNLRTVMGTAQVSGVVLLAAAKRALPIGLHTPTEVKAAVTGYGQAEKRQVGTMVAKILGLTEVPKPADASDALALALCHAWRFAAVGTQGAALDSQSTGETSAQIAWRAAEAAAKKPRAGRRLAR